MVIRVRSQGDTGLHKLTKSRFRGCLLGLGVGDALGTTLEFKEPGTFEPIEDIVGGGPFHLQPGQWTDDTSMALCLAESLIKCEGFDARHQMDLYVRWYKNGYLASNGRCFDIGNTVRDALERFLRKGEPFAGSTDPLAAGNGSLMRLAPIPMFYASSLLDAVEYAEESSRTTHGCAEAVDACRVFSYMLVHALSGASKEAILQAPVEDAQRIWQESSLSETIDEVAKGSYRHREPPSIEGSGYVVRTLEAALWAFDRSESFREGALLAVNLGDDADTTGAIYGQIAGAYYGAEGIPVEWRNRLTMADKIRVYADELFKLAT